MAVISDLIGHNKVQLKMIGECTMTHKKAVNNPKNVTPNVTPKLNIIRFTDTTIRNLKSLPNKRIEYKCNTLDGFAIRVTPKGTKTWGYRYRFNGKLERITFGNYPEISLREARRKYFEASEKVEHGINPSEEKRNKKQRLTELEEKRKSSQKISELIPKYIEHCKREGKATWQNELYALEKDFIPVFGHVPVIEVSTIENVSLLHKMFTDIRDVRKSPSMASHLYAYVRRFFNYLAQEQLIRFRDNPCHEIKLGIKKKTRERHLSFEEIYLFWHGLEKVNTSEIIRLGLKMMLCTVARGIEVRNMKWRDIDTKHTVWLKPKTKNKKMHRIHFHDLAKDLLDNAHVFTGKSQYVFGSTHRGRMRLTESSDILPMKAKSYSQPLNRHFNKLDIKERFTPHDLRRTAATIVASVLGKKDLLKKLLNHSDNDVTDIYDQYLYDDEKKLGTEALNYALTRIINSPDIENVPTHGVIREEFMQLKRTDSSENRLNDPKILSKAPLANTVSYSMSYPVIA